jgi:hypothetical protein
VEETVVRWSEMNVFVFCFGDRGRREVEVIVEGVFSLFCLYLRFIHLQISPEGVN